VAAVGDPQQIAVAGMAIAAGQKTGVLLAGGTQMLAVHALIEAIARRENYPLSLDNIAVGTTRWVAEDANGDTIGLARLVGNVPLLASGLNFSGSKYPALQAYERGFVKEGVGAGACAIIAELYGNWTNDRLVMAIENLLGRAG
jgi:NaMN:DMB phosphoribosyltransferase